MVKQKLLGYVFALVGLAGLAVSGLPNLSKMLPFEIPAFIGAKYLMIGSLICVIIGSVLAFSGKGKGKHASEEVPIYEGNKVVGYRRG